MGLVVDWPISAGLSGGEHKNFFKWAKHFNNYHPEATDEILRLKVYRILRYQTEIFDESVSSVRVFCEQEQQFLESCCWLRQLPEFFKPRELFGGMEESQSQQQAEKMLLNSEVGRQNILYRCQCIAGIDALCETVASAVP